MFKNFFKLLEEHKKIEKEQKNTIIDQYIEIVKLRTVLSNVEVITKLNRAGTGMGDIYLNEIKELVTNIEKQ